MDLGELYTCILHYNKQLESSEDRLDYQKSKLDRIRAEGANEEAIDKELESVLGLSRHIADLKTKIGEYQAQYDNKRGPIRPIDVIRAEIDATIRTAQAINEKRNNARFVNPDPNFSEEDSNREMISCLLQRAQLIDETFKTGLTDVEKHKACLSLINLHKNLSDLYKSVGEIENSKRHTKLHERYNSLEPMYFQRIQD